MYKILLVNFVETIKHKGLVFWYMLKVCRAIMYRAIFHDMSKFSKVEALLFGQAAMSKSAYGTEDYNAVMASLKPALDHHYRMNSHHPEHHFEGIKGMSPLDELEMLCDWKAAGQRRYGTGSMAKSLEINAERFNIDIDRQIGYRMDSLEIGLL